MAKVEGLVCKNQGPKGLLPDRNVGTAHAQRARAYDWANHGVILADVGVCPAK